MDNRLGWKLISVAGAIGLAACQTSAAPARTTTSSATTTTSGGTAFVQYDDGYRDGYHDGGAAARTDGPHGASISHAAAEPATPVANSTYTSVSIPTPTEADVRVRAEERDVARRGGAIPYDPADPIADPDRRARHARTH
jgi:hypothetical protein